MSTCVKCENFVEGGTYPEGKDGSCIWSEKDLRGGMVTYSRPASKTGSCERFHERKEGATRGSGQ